MTLDWYTILIQFLLPVVLAALSGGAIVGYFQYRGSRPEAMAKAKQINSVAEISIGEAWEKYARSVEARFEKLEKAFTDYKKEKDDEVAALNRNIVRLETELSKYQKVEVKVEEARETIHTAVDQTIDAIKRPGENGGNAT